MKNLRPLFIFGALFFPFAGNAQYKSTSSDKTIFYKLERNEPANSGLFGVSVNPAYVDLNSPNLNIGGGLELFYTFKSHLRITGGYHIAYFDNIGGDAEKDAPYGSWNSYGTPVKSRKSSCLDVLVSPTIFSWEKEKNYHITLGSAGYRTIAVTHVRGNVMKALTARLGYQVDNRIVQPKDGNAFKTTTPAYVYYYQGNPLPLMPDNMASSSTMIKSDIAVIGIAYSSFRDIRISLDNAKYTGRREEKAQTDLFVDFLYAHKLNLQDMIYYHSLPEGGKQLPQRLDLSATPLTKTGFRIGFQTISMYHPNFGSKFAFEFGSRPGIKTADKNSNLYGQITFGFIFGGRIAKQQEGE